jgi:hypothetical protein
MGVALRAVAAAAWFVVVAAACRADPTPPPPAVTVAPITQPPSLPARGGAPRPLLRGGVDPVGLVVPEGGTARFAALLTNVEAEPIEIRPVPPTLTLYTASGEAVRTFPGGRGAVTIPPGGTYRHEIVWDLRRDDGTLARPGRYGAGLETLDVLHAGGRSNITMGLGGAADTLVIDPAGGARTGVLPLALSVTEQGSTLTLDRLVLERTSARLEAHVTPPWPRGGALPGSPLGEWSVFAAYRLDGGPPIGVRSPGFNPDASRIGLTWSLDAIPATARELELTVRVSGALWREWKLRVPLPAP